MGLPRRRSVDIGGLALALSDEGLGHGWGGWEETEKGETRYAEVLIDVRAHTETIVNLEPLQLSPYIIVEEDTRTRLIGSLGSWHFEPHKLPEEEVLACTYILFESLFRIEGMQEDAGVSLTQIATFLQHLRQNYRRGNSYHNFQHALDVFQATYFFLYTAGIVPPVSILSYIDGRLWKPDKKVARNSHLACLVNEDLLALYIAAVGHDVGHPGLTNAFLRNAKTPLAEVYDDKSILEQMHHSLMLQIMKSNGLGVLLDRPISGQRFRKLLFLIVIATDMGIHPEFMTRFQEMIDGNPVDSFQERVLVCQAIIKCADISNPARPYLVAQHWAAALESEWTSQLLLEQHLNLPTSVRPAKDEISEASGQVFFLTAFARPLFDLTAMGLPGKRSVARLVSTK
ncbi:hypothetical protein PHLCEN_2v1166 [Hermanssonia centrifuga]|uniref:PDEase domain-containing protein n=1 Tax=Hermanssonia centrifuga TaxID=98765 RepID=A0A2R6S3T2_9APHY|nr:hypothetical protein PHLCEN_2v1166 [Hermanssonia centrifuga]